MPRRAIVLVVAVLVVLAIVPVVGAKWYAEFSWSQGWSQPDEAALLLAGQTIELPTSTEPGAARRVCDAPCDLPPQFQPTTYRTGGLLSNDCWLVHFEPATDKLVWAASLKGGATYTAKLVAAGSSDQRGAQICVVDSPHRDDAVTLWTGE